MNTWLNKYLICTHKEEYGLLVFKLIAVRSDGEVLMRYLSVSKDMAEDDAAMTTFREQEFACVDEYLGQ